jgi:hypothetical protein
MPWFGQIMKIIVPTVAAITVMTAFAANAQPQYSHAQFVEGARSMKSLIEFPDIDHDISITVICSGHATAKGRLKDARCSAPNDPNLAFTMVVSRRFNSVRLIPALVNGKAKKSIFSLLFCSTSRMTPRALKSTCTI